MCEKLFWNKCSKNLRKSLKLKKLRMLNFNLYRRSRPEVFYEKVFLKISNNSQENTCPRASLLIKLQASFCNFIKKETPAQVFSCEFCEIFKSTFFTEYLRVTASDLYKPSLLRVLPPTIFTIWRHAQQHLFSYSTNNLH